MASSLLVLSVLVPQVVSQPLNSAVSASMAPITNAEVLGMLQAGLHEAVIVAAIEAREANFDNSLDALIALRSAGATDVVLRAIMARRPATEGGQPTPAAESEPAQPYAGLLRGDAQQALPKSYAQITQAKYKLGDDFKSVATSMAAQELVLVAGAGVVASTAINFGATAAHAIMGPLVAASMLFRKAPTYTFILALSGSQATTKLAGGELRAEIRYGDLPGVDPDTHEPLLLKLAPTKSNLRIVRAQNLKLKRDGFQAKEEVLQQAVPVTLTQLGRGHLILEATALAPGEYGLILRNKAPSEALVFGAPGQLLSGTDLGSTVWDFSIAPVEQKATEASEDAAAPADPAPRP